MTTTINETEVDGRLGVVVAELSGSLLRLHRQLDDQRDALAGLRAEMAQEIRTERLVVDDSDRMSTTITPGRVTVECEPDVAEATSGSHIHLCSVAHAAALTVSSGSSDDVADLVVTLYAGSENSPSTAYVEVEAPGERKSLGVQVPETAQS